jgi:hypothetical protein
VRTLTDRARARAEAVSNRCGVVLYFVLRGGQDNRGDGRQPDPERQGPEEEVNPGHAAGRRREGSPADKEVETWKSWRSKRTYRWAFS